MNEGRPYSATGNAHEVQRSGERLTPASDLMKYFQQYASERPAVVALWCIGIGFVLGWKLKPW